MSIHFVSPLVSSFDDIRGSSKSKGIVDLGTNGTFVVLAEDNIDLLTATLPTPSDDSVVTVSSLVKIWSLQIKSSSHVMLPRSNLEIDFGSSIQLNYSKAEDCWILIRSF